MSEELKNVVIVGAAAAGANVAKALMKSLPSTHRIVLIDANEFAYWPIGALRASVKPGFEKEIFASLENFFPSDSRHIVLRGYTVIKFDSDSVQLDKQAPGPFNSDTIQVDVGVIATGSSYAFPMRPSSPSIEESVSALQLMQKDIAKAKHIVILGGGPVGVEFAGEVQEVHPDKKITLIERSPRLLNGWRDPLHRYLYNQLQKKKIDVRLDTSVEVNDDLQSSAQKFLDQPLTLSLSDGSTIETDFLFIGTGGLPNVAGIPEEALAQDASSNPKKPIKRVQVDQGSLRVQYEPLKARWFCLGDACDTKDSKTNVAATTHAPIVASQIIGQIGQTKKGVKLHSKAPSVMFVPIGSSGGASQVIWPVFGQWVTSIKSKTLFVSMFSGTYPGGQPLKA